VAEKELTEVTQAELHALGWVKFDEGRYGYTMTKRGIKAAEAVLRNMTPRDRLLVMVYCVGIGREYER
jgi:Mn-dependent DtxR family transcriptional regulator